MRLLDLKQGTLFYEKYGDESNLLWRIVEKCEDIKVAKCALVGSRSRTEYKSFLTSVIIHPTQQTLF